MDSPLRSWAFPTGGAVRRSVGRYPIVAYLCLVFAFSWTAWLVGVPRTSGPPQLLVVLCGAWGPTVVALLLTAIRDGRSGVRRLVGRLIAWRIPLRWYGLAMLLVPATALCAVGVVVAAGGSIPPVVTPGDMGPLVIPAVFVVNVFVGGPLAEELGWRGFALPLLTERFGLRAAAVSLGVVWALWHLPFFVLPSEFGVVAGFPLWAYVPAVIAWSVLVSWLVVGAGWSVLVAVLFHASVNTTLGTFGLVSVENTPLLVTFVAVQVGVAVLLVVVVTRRSLPDAAPV